MCGATAYRTQQDQLNEGLSPRVWGNLFQKNCYTLTGRPIPTCVGQPLEAKQRMLKLEAYPHVCGATYVIAKNVVGRHGLSPRVWGNLRHR